MLITFSGVDCAGKSTQIELLRQHFISLGKSCAVFWYRPGYSHELQCLKGVLRKAVSLWPGHETQLSSQTADASGREKKPFGASSRRQARLWLFAALVDSLLQWGAKLRWMLARYDVVLCDRYFWDGMLDLLFRYPEEYWSEGAMAVISKAFPKADCAVLLWVPQEIMKQRAAQKAEPFPDDDGVRDLRWRIYDVFRARDLFTNIDASEDVETIHQRIVDAVQNA